MNGESIVCRVTSLKILLLLTLSSCFPKRLREGHKNFDVYPRDKKPILSVQRNKASPFSRPLVSACARTRFSYTTELAKSNMRTLRGFLVTQREDQARGTLKDRGWVSLCKCIAGDTREAWEHRVVRAVTRHGHKVFGNIMLPNRKQKTREEDMKIRTILLSVYSMILLYFMIHLVY